MACILLGTNGLPNQFWYTMTCTRRNEIRWNSNQYSKNFFWQNAFENVCENSGHFCHTVYTLMKIIIIHFRRSCILSCISLHNWSQPVFHKIPQCTCPISHYVPFRTEKCTFLFWIVGYGTGALWDLWIWSIVVYYTATKSHSTQVNHIIVY